MRPIIATGPTTVERLTLDFDPNEGWCLIETEIIQMSLTGTYDPGCEPRDVTVTLDPDPDGVGRCGHWGLGIVVDADRDKREVLAVGPDHRSIRVQRNYGRVAGGLELAPADNTAVNPALGHQGPGLVRQPPVQMRPTGSVL